MNDRKGGFNAASYASLMIGVPDAGPVVMPGDAQGSRLIEVIESGDMPRGGLQITAAERKTLEQWITDGAKFDGENPSTSLTRLTGTSPPTAPEMDVAVVAATGKESVSFSRDIAPVLVAQCLGCHGGRQARNGLSFSTFGDLIKGGDSGVIVDRKSPNMSLLLTKINGTGPGQRMPLNRPQLSDELIATFQKWLAEGATFDGKSPTMPLATVAALYKAKNFSHDELAQERTRIARQNWRLALPDMQPNTVETENFLVIGSRSEVGLSEVAKASDEYAVTVRKLLKTDRSSPFIKGRATLFVIDRRYDYAEFGKMVEQRQLPPTLGGHWNYTLVDAYGVVVWPRDESLPSFALAEQIASICVANFGDDVPEWFSSGVGRAVAAKMVPKDPALSRWQRRVDESKIKPADLLSGRAPPEIAGPVMYAFCTQAWQSGRGFARLKSSLVSGAAFEPAWRQAYGASPEELLTVFLK